MLCGFYNKYKVKYTTKYMFKTLPSRYFIIFEPMFFDFHHHHHGGRAGIYNYDCKGAVPQNPFSAGIHPADAERTELWKQLTTAASDPSCVAIGECGLDNLVSPPLTVQEQLFRQQIRLAEDLQKPLIVHCVRQHERTAHLCRDLSVSVIFHGFNRKQTIAEQLTARGFYLSFGASLLKNLSLQNSFLHCPTDLILLETDDSPIPIETLYRQAAALLNTSVETVQEIIAANLNKILK